MTESKLPSDSAELSTLKTVHSKPPGPANPGPCGGSAEERWLPEPRVWALEAAEKPLYRPCSTWALGPAPPQTPLLPVTLEHTRTQNPQPRKGALRQRHPTEAREETHVLPSSQFPITCPCLPLIELNRKATSKGIWGKSFTDFQTPVCRVSRRQGVKLRSQMT